MDWAFTFKNLNISESDLKNKILRKIKEIGSPVPSKIYLYELPDLLSKVNGWNFSFDTDTKEYYNPVKVEEFDNGRPAVAYGILRISLKREEYKAWKTRLYSVFLEKILELGRDYKNNIGYEFIKELFFDHVDELDLDTLSKNIILDPK